MLCTGTESFYVWKRWTRILQMGRISRGMHRPLLVKVSSPVGHLYEKGGKSTLLSSSVCHHKWQNPDTLKSVGLWRLTSHLHPLPFESPTACLALLKSIGGTFSPLHLSLCTEKDKKRWIFFFFFFPWPSSDVTGFLQWMLALAIFRPSIKIYLFFPSGIFLLTQLKPIKSSAMMVPFPHV